MSKFKSKPEQDDKTFNVNGKALRISVGYLQDYSARLETEGNESAALELKGRIKELIDAEVTEEPAQSPERMHIHIDARGATDPHAVTEAVKAAIKEHCAGPCNFYTVGSGVKSAGFHIDSPGVTDPVAEDAAVADAAKDAFKPIARTCVDSVDRSINARKVTGNISGRFCYHNVEDPEMFKRELFKTLSSATVDPPFLIIGTEPSTGSHTSH